MENLDEYKREIIEMVEKIENECFLKMIYGFVKNLYEKSRAGN